ALQSDGKLLVGGTFLTFNGTAINRIARILPTGDLDTAFDIGTGPNFSVNKVALQEDGKILIGGLFGSYNGVAALYIARINPDGSHDPTFLEGGPIISGHRNIAGGATDIVSTSDGKVYVS